MKYGSLKRTAGALLLAAVFAVTGVLAFHVPAYAEENALAQNNAGAFMVTGDSGWNYSNNTLTFTESGTYTVAGGGAKTSDHIVVSGNNLDITITLKDVNIEAGAAFVGKGGGQTGVNLTVNLQGTNVLKSTGYGNNNAGLTWNNADAASLLTIKSDTGTGSLTAYGAWYGAGIGGSMGSNIGCYSSYITISSGIIDAHSGNHAAGIGGGYQAQGSHITITGGTVTANGWGIGGGADRNGDNLVISGGSVKAEHIRTNNGPNNSAGKRVRCVTVPTGASVNTVTVDGTNIYTRNGAHPDGDGSFYLYLTYEDHAITWSEGDISYIASYNSSTNEVTKKIIPSAAPQEANVTARTKNSVAVTTSADTNVYGDVQYQIVEAGGAPADADWQTSNTFTGLSADASYDVYVRYAGNDEYAPSAPVRTNVTTKKDGESLIVTPAPSPATYTEGLKLSGIILPAGWIWGNGDTVLSSAGEASYKAFFDTTAYENEYDFEGVTGYDSRTHEVIRDVAVAVNKGTLTEAAFQLTGNSEFTYDGSPKGVSVSLSPEKVGAGVISVKYYQGNAEVKKPTDAGSYTVKIDVAEGANYNNAASLEIGTLRILPKALSNDAGITFVGTHIYDGQEWKPALTVADGEKTLTIRKDYEVSYPADMTGVGDKVITVTFKGNYAGAKEVTGAVKYLDAPAAPYEFTKGYIQGDIVWIKEGNKAEITPPAGYSISSELNGAYSDVLETDSQIASVYLKNNQGQMTGAISVSEEIKTDAEAPAATIKIENNEFKEFLNTITFGLFFKETKEIEIESADNESGVKTTEYCVSEKAMTKEELEQAEWEAYTGLSLNPDRKAIVYARVTDNVGNVTIVNSDGIVVYTDSEQKTEEITYTKTTKENVGAKVILNGNTVSSIRNGEKELIKETDYTVSENGTITFSYEYLDSLKAGEYVFTVSYHPMGEEYVEKEGNKAPAATEIKLSVNKADSLVKFKDGVTFDKAYDTKAVVITEEDVEKSGSTGNVRFTFEKKVNDEWQPMKEAPVAAGAYRVTAVLEEDDNYNFAEATLEFKIAKAAPAKADANISNNGKGISGAETGNNTNISLYISLFAMSGFFIASLAVLRKKKALENK